MDKPSAQAQLSFVLNDKPVRVDVAPGTRLSQVLRDDLGARDVKIGCNAGDCGACSVLVDGNVVCACLMPVAQVAERRVDTVSGLTAEDPIGQRLADAFHDHGAAQCGICIPGMIVTATDLLRRTAAPSEAEVKDALGGVLCRCTGYRKIIDAVLAASRADALPQPTDGAVGASLRRVDGRPKVAGTEVFGDDVAPAGTRELHLVRSPHPAAQFELGDLTAFEARHEGIDAVLTARDVTGRNLFGTIPGFIDQPVFANGVVRFRGEAIAAIVARPGVISETVLNDFPVKWSPVPAFTSTVTAKAENARQLHDDRPGNVMCTGFVKSGDASRAMSTAAVTAEGRFSSGFVEHAYIEPEAGFAERKGNRIEIHACTQAPVMDQETVAAVLGLELEQVRILPTATGGGFGSKLDVSVQPYLALAAWITGHPVRLTYSRRESMQSTTKRHPSDMHVRIGATESGRLTAMEFDGDFNTGAYSSWGPTVATRVPVHASGPYAIPNYIARATGIFTNAPPAGAFRGFGVPQAAIALESLLDDLAEKLGKDPLELRVANALTNGTRTVCGQVFSQGVGIKACLEALRPAWQAEKKAAIEANLQNPTIRRGVGVAAGWYGCGNTSISNPSTFRAGIRTDGKLVLHQGAVDIGQGANTVMAQIFAEALGVPALTVTLESADTDITPDGGKTSASRQTFVSGNAARLAGETLRRRILERVNAEEDATLAFEMGCIHVTGKASSHKIDLGALPVVNGYVFEAIETYDPPTKPLDENGQGEPYAQYGYAAQLAVVEVDTELGTVKAIGFTAAHDVGRAINPLLVEGQVHGGIAQGLGMALMEEYLPGQTENLHDYLIPTIGDIPPINTIIIEEPDLNGPYGAKGLGEHVLIPTAPAILNAIYHATGARIRDLPASPTRVLAAIEALSDD